MDDEGLHRLLREELERDQTAQPSESVLTDAQWRAMSSVIRKRSLEDALHRHSGASDIRLEDHASLITDLAAALSQRYPATARLIWDLACDVMKLERSLATSEPAEGDRLLQQRHARTSAKHRQLLAHWRQLREP